MIRFQLENLVSSDAFPTTGTETAPAIAGHMAAEALRHVVTQNARRWRGLVLVEAVGGVTAVLLGYFLFAVVLDGALHLPVAGRLAVNAIFIAAAVVLALRLVGRLRSIRLGEDEVALAIERQTPGGMQNRLINTLQLARDAGTHDAVLTAAVVRENCAHLGQTGLPPAARSRPAAVRVAIVAGLALVGAGLILWQPARFWRSVSRVLLPLARIEPVYRTTLVVEPGDIETAGDVVLRITIQGERAHSVTIFTDCQGQRESITIPVPTDEHSAHQAPNTKHQTPNTADETPNTELTHTLVGISRSLTYTVSANDFTSPTYHITVPTPVALTLLRVTYELPAYCQREKRTVEQAGGDLEALQGTSARLSFVFDQAVEDAALLLDRVPAGPEPERLPLERVGPSEFAGTLVLEKLASYHIESRQRGSEARHGPRYAVRLLADKEPHLEMTGIDRQVEVEPDATLGLKVRATDDFGLTKLGLFTRPAGAASTERDEAWSAVVEWPVTGKAEFRIDRALPVSALKAGEGERVELALRAIDTDPSRAGRWSTGPVHQVLVGGEGALLQMQYEQILKSEAGLAALLAEQKTTAEASNAWVRKLDGDGDLRWDDPKNIEMLHAALKTLAGKQAQQRQRGGQLAREMIPQTGDLRLGLGLLADTEMNRAQMALESVPGRESPQAKRTAIVEAGAAQERTIRSLEEMSEALAAFRTNWELSHMLPFVRMLADRQKQLAKLSNQHSSDERKSADKSLAASAHKRQEKVLDLVRLIQPAFGRLAKFLESREAILSQAFAAGTAVLGSDGVQVPLQKAADEIGAGHWGAAIASQEAAAKQLAELHERLNQARLDSARQMLAALREEARSNTEAQKAIEQLKLGTAEDGVKDFPNDIKIDDIVRTREVTQAKRPGGGADNKVPAPGDAFDDVDRSKLELLKDSGVRQDPNILSLGNTAEPTQRLPSAVDVERNKVKPFVQEELADLVGKLLEEADEIDKNYQTLTLSTNLNNSDPGDIAKQGGRINSTGAVAATGNKKPPTTNHGGVSRSGRSGARAYGKILGDEAVSRRGRDEAQEGEQRVPDQEGTIKETKSEDPYTDTSTGVGGKKVESDETNFSVKNAGKFTPDMLDRMDKAQKKYAIVERQGDPLDPRLAALLRDTTSKQSQLVERLKAIRKELKTLYLPTDHVDQAMRDLGANLERLKERPDPELFRLERETLERMRGAVKVFRETASSLQPSLPRERVIRGRVLDEPGRQTLPGYEAAVKRYYEQLANQ